MWHTRRMKTPHPTSLYKRHRFPAEIISHGVWLYFRFCQNSRHEREADEEDHSDLVYAAVIMPINLVNRS
jgi:putative transposase